MKRIFVLGCERSGSTWLSNILDAHPNVEFIMEPFADYAGLFPDFPGRNIYISTENEHLIRSIQTGYQQLYEIKYPLFYKPNRALFLKWIDRFLLNKYQKYATLLKITPPPRVEQYRLLHLHTSAIPVSKHPPKNYNQPVEVTKELRLNFKVGLLARAFSEAKYLIIIRHPGAQISSIKKLFQKGRLGELHRSLTSFIDCVKNCNRFKDYWTIIDEVDWKNDIESRLILWWLINYEVLIEDIRLNNLDYLIIPHEKLSRKPHQVTTQILEFCELMFEDSVKNYLNTSSNSISNKSSQDFSPVNTIRDSANYYKQVIADVDLALNDKIIGIISRVSALKGIEPYLAEYLNSFYIF